MINLFRKILRFFGRVVSGDTSESTKRVISLFSMTLVTFVIIAYTTKDNAIIMLDSLLLFILSLMGISTWQAYKTNKGVNNKKDEK